MKKWKSAILTAISLLFSIKLWLEIPLMKKVFESESIGTTSTTRKNGALMTHNCSNRLHSAVTWYLSNLWNYIFYPHSQSTNPNSLSLIGYVIFFSWYSAHFIHFSIKQLVVFFFKSTFTSVRSFQNYLMAASALRKTPDFFFVGEVLKKQGRSP